MTSKLGAIVAILTALVGAELLSAAEIVTPPAFKNVVSGKRTMLGRFYDLNPDCSSAGKVILRIMQNPRNGIAEIISEQGFSGYPKDDPRNKCNEKALEVEKIFYKSNDEFKGKDQFIIEAFYPNGNYRKLTVNIDVRSAE